MHRRDKSAMVGGMANTTSNIGANTNAGASTSTTGGNTGGAAATASFGYSVYAVVSYLKQCYAQDPDAPWKTAEDIRQGAGVDLGSHPELKAQLEANAAVETKVGLYAFRPKYAFVRSQDDLRQLLQREFHVAAAGVKLEHLLGTFKGVETAIKELIQAGEAIIFLPKNPQETNKMQASAGTTTTTTTMTTATGTMVGKKREDDGGGGGGKREQGEKDKEEKELKKLIEGKRNLLFYWDPKFRITVDPEFKKLWKNIKVPDDVDLRRELDRVGHKKLRTMSSDDAQGNTKLEEMKKPTTRKRRGPRTTKLVNTHIAGLVDFSTEFGQ